MAEDHRDSDMATPPPTNWAKVADGVFLAGLGVFFLLATTRGLPDGFWVDALTLWPVLLVSAGIRIVFERTRLAAGVVLGPLVVLGTLFWLAWGNPAEPRPPGDWHRVVAERPEGTDRARVTASLGAAALSLEARPMSPSLLAEGRAAARDSETALEVEHEDGEARVRLRGRKAGAFFGFRRQVWEVGLSDRVPLRFEITGAGLAGDLDLRRGHTTGAQFQGAFNAITLRLPPPESQVTIKVEGAFQSFDVVVPEGTPVAYNGPGFPIRLVNRGPAVDALPDGVPGYRLEVGGAFFFLGIEEGPPPEGGWPAPLPTAEGAEKPALPPEDPGQTSAGTDTHLPAEDPNAEPST